MILLFRGVYTLFTIIEASLKTLVQLDMKKDKLYKVYGFLDLKAYNINKKEKIKWEKEEDS